MGPSSLSRSQALTRPADGDEGTAFQSRRPAGRRPGGCIARRQHGPLRLTFSAGDAANTGGPMFTLGDQLHIGGGGPDGGASMSPTTSPLFGQEDALTPMPFAFDDDVDDDVPILRLGDEDEDEEHPIPTFRLDDDDVDDDVPIAGVRPAQPEVSMGPVFDLSSELENQLPQPLARPNYDLTPEADASATQGMTAPPSVDAPAAGGDVPFHFETPESTLPQLARSVRADRRDGPDGRLQRPTAVHAGEPGHRGDRRPGRGFPAADF